MSRTPAIRSGIVPLWIVALLAAASCADHDARDSLDHVRTEPVARPSTAVSQAFPSPYRQSINFDATSSASLPRIQESALALDDDEREVLARNGFVISDRKAFPGFLMAYAEVYRNDLPVYVSADSILHALHKSYDAMLRRVESVVLGPLLRQVLIGLRRRLAVHRGDIRARSSLDLHLAVALSLLEGKPVAPVAGADASHIAALVDRAHQHEGISEVALFGSKRLVDFSQFAPRGHYAEGEELQRYFRATMWLGRIDFRLVDTDREGRQALQRPQLEAALLLTSLVRGAVRKQWDGLDAIVTAFTSDKDQLDLRDMTWLTNHLNIVSQASLRRIPDERLLETLVGPGTTQQRIASQPVVNNDGAPVPPAVSFALLPQRFTPESEVMTRVTYDRVPRRRFLPSTLDVAFAAFGNNQAGELLAPEILKWGYGDELLDARAGFTLPTDRGFYRGWLEAIRALSLEENQFKGLPTVARTDAWGRRLLNTQLASWAELRRDTILYAKQSYGTIACEYPDGYVDPYPEFFDRMIDVALVGQQMTAHVAELASDLDLPEARWEHRVGSLAEHMGAYFVRLRDVSMALQEMARLERKGEPLREDHVAFLNRAVSASTICGGFVTDGWYADLFFDEDTATEFKPTIADVHTDPNDPPRVLYAATGAPRLMYVTLDGEPGRTYVGPVSSYFEKVEGGLQRWSDEAWKRSLLDSHPAAVPWMEDVVVRAESDVPASPMCEHWNSVLMYDGIRDRGRDWPWPMP